MHERETIIWTRQMVEDVLVRTLHRQRDTLQADRLGAVTGWPDYHDRNDYAREPRARTGERASIEDMEAVLEGPGSWGLVLVQRFGEAHGARLWSLAVCVGLSRYGQVRAWRYGGNLAEGRVDWTKVADMAARLTTHRFCESHRTLRRHYVDALTAIAEHLTCHAAAA